MLIEPLSRTLASRRTLLKAGLGLTVVTASQASRAEETWQPRFLLQWGREGSVPGEFNTPIGIAVSRADEVFVTDYHHDRVQRFTSEGKLLSVISVGAHPGGIAIAPNGEVYVGHFGHDNQRDRVAVYSPSGQLLREWGKTGTADGEFNQTGGIALGPDLTVYVADQTNRRVQRFTPEGKFLGKWGEYGTGPGQFGGNVSPTWRVGGPQFLGFDSKGYLYTTEASVCRVQKFTRDGKYVWGWVNATSAPGGFGGRPRNLPGPIAVCADRNDHVWVSSTNNRVQLFTGKGRYLRGFGAEGTGAGQFHSPHGLALDSQGHLYVVDTQNHRIQKFAVSP